MLAEVPLRRDLVDRTQQALAQMAQQEPELAARLIIQALPAAAAKVQGPLTYSLTVADMGEYTVSVDGAGHAQVTPGLTERADFRLSTNAAGLAEMGAGVNPLKLIVSGRVRIRGHRLKARRLRAMSDGPVDLGAVLASGGEVDPDL